MKNLVKIAVAASFAVLPAQAFAATGNVQFNATVTHTCVITVGSAGTLTASTDFTTLGSTQAGGSAGTATVAASGNGFKISVDAPSLSKPATDTTSETLTSAYSASGATSTSGTNASAANNLAHGTTNVSVNMTAVKSGSNVFEAGTYTGTVVLRCE
jgi:hypothetical protein